MKAFNKEKRLRQTKLKIIDLITDTEELETETKNSNN